MKSHLTQQFDIFSIIALFSVENKVGKKKQTFSFNMLHPPVAYYYLELLVSMNSYPGIMITFINAVAFHIKLVLPTFRSSVTLNLKCSNLSVIYVTVTLKATCMTF